MDYLLENCKIVPAVVPSAGAATTMTPVEVDARGYSRALFILATGAQATGGTLDAKIQKAATAGGSLADCTDAALVQLGASSGSKIYAIEVTVDPAKPFMKVTGTIGTDTIANSITCLLHGGSGQFPKSAPATQAIKA
jgi:hypothetical protein